MVKSEIWLRGMLAAVISGGANGVSTGFAAIGIDPTHFNLAAGFIHTLSLAGVSAVMSGIIGVAAYLKQSPLPGNCRDEEYERYAEELERRGERYDRDADNRRQVFPGTRAEEHPERNVVERNIIEPKFGEPNIAERHVIEGAAEHASVEHAAERGVVEHTPGEHEFGDHGIAGQVNGRCAVEQAAEHFTEHPVTAPPAIEHPVMERAAVERAAIKRAGDEPGNISGARSDERSAEGCDRHQDGRQGHGRT